MARSSVRPRASPLASTDGIGIAVARPDGTILATAFNRGDLPAVIERLTLAETGRHRIIVFDVRGTLSGRDRPTPASVGYRLRVEDANGGALEAGKTVKGVATRANGLAVWTLDVPAGGLINTRLTNLTPLAWTPHLYIADPAGRIIAEVTGAAGESVIERLGVRAAVAGQYRVLVAGVVGRSYASYRLISDVLIPFTQEDAETIRIGVVQPIIGRYALSESATAAPVRVNIADLINPLVSPAALPNAGVLGLDTSARGEIPVGTLGQAWQFSVITGTVIQLRAMALSRDAAPTITLWDRTNAIIGEQFRVDDNTATLTYRVIAGGTFTAVVGMGVGGGRYLLTLSVVNVTISDLSIADGRPLLYGQSVHGELVSGGEADAYYFLGTRDDLITFALSSDPQTPAPRAVLAAPDGAILASGSALGSASLPANGIYTLRVNAPEEEGSGRYTLTLGLVNAPRLRARGGGLITAGTTVSGLLNREDGEDTWLFRGYRGERVTFVAAASGALAPLTVRLLDTNGETFSIQESALAGSVVRLQNLTLPSDGVYRVQVTGGVTGAGVYTLAQQPESGERTSGALRYGETVTGIFTAGHPFESWTFAGTVGDVLSIALRYARGTPFLGSFQVRAENGLALATVGDLGDGRGARADIQLPFSGSYTIIVGNPDPAFVGAGVYALSINLQESRARSMGAIVRYGETAAGDLYPDDAEDTWLFNARAGDRVRVEVRAGDSFLKPTLAVRTPGGDTLMSVEPDGDVARIGFTPETILAIPADGVYVMTIGAAGGSSGSYKVRLDYTPPPIAEIDTLTYGASRPGLIADDRPEEFYTFSGGDGDRITVTLNREPGASLSGVIRLETETGAILATADSLGTDRATLTDYRLPRAGTYRLVATRYLGISGATFGRYTIHLEGTPNPGTVRGTVRPGSRGIGRLDDAAPSDRLRFSGVAGEVVALNARATSGDLDIVMRVEDGGGNILAQADDSEGLNARINGVLLPNTGDYTIILTRTGRSAGNYEVALQSLYRDSGEISAAEGLSYGRRAVGTLDRASDSARYTFNGAAGDVVTMTLLHQTDDAPPELVLRDPAGTTLQVGSLEIGRTTIRDFQLAATGRYVITIRRPANAAAAFSPYAMTLNLSSAAGDPAATGGILTRNKPAVGIFSPAESAHYWLFRGAAGERIAVHLLSLSSDLRPAAILLSPAGNAIRIAEPREGAFQIAPFTLPTDGLYTILIVPGGAGDAGQYRLTLADGTLPAEPPSITPGVPTTGIIDTLTRAMTWTFEGRAGQFVTIRAVTTAGSLIPALILSGSDGLALAEGSLEGVSSAITRLPLPANGTYTLTLRARDNDPTLTGTFRLLLSLDSSGGMLSAAATIALPITFGGTTRVNLQQDTATYFAFDSAEGETILLAAAGAQADGAPHLEVQDSTGMILARAEPTAGVRDTILSGVVIPTTGRYIVALSAPLTGSYTLTLQRRASYLPADLATAAARNLPLDTPQQDSISNRNASDLWTFTGVGGSVIQLSAERVSSDLRLDIALFLNGRALTTITGAADATAIQTLPVRLPETGTYVVVISRWLGAGGTTQGVYRLTAAMLNDVVEAEIHLPTYGVPKAGLSGDHFTFDGAAGTVIEAHIRPLGEGKAFRPLVTMSLPGESSPFAVIEATESADGYAARVVLPTTGRYTILITPTNDTERSPVRLIVKRLLTPTSGGVEMAQGIRYGERKSSTVAPQTPAQAWLFYGRAGDRIIAEARPTLESSLDPFLTLIAPDGTILYADDNSGGNLAGRITGYVLPRDGFFALVVSASPLIPPGDGAFGANGAFDLSLERGYAGAAFQGFAPFGSAVTGILSDDYPVQEWLLDDLASAPSVGVSITTNAPTFTAQAYLVAKGGALPGAILARAAPDEQGTITLEAATPPDGRVGIILIGASGSSGNYRLVVSSAIAPSGGGILRGDGRGFGTISDADYSDTWRVTIPNEDRELVISAARSSGTLVLEIAVFAADGTLLAKEALSPETLDQPLIIPPLPIKGGVVAIVVSRAGGANGDTVGGYSIEAFVR
ncbi:MAG TPA: hypothetical protein PLD47_03920 [Aggregatilineales bacterium]|nr:hypothetical protein [Aggregatilineales bacterium]